MTTELRQVTVLGHDVRVSVRPGTEPGPPLLLCNGIGASLDLLQPFVDALDERIEVVRFDVPGVGGSPDPKVPYNFALLAIFVARLMTTLGYDRFDVLGISWGGGLAQQVAFQLPEALPPGGPGQHRHRLGDGAGRPAGAAQDGHAASLPRRGLRRHRRGRAVRRPDARAART